MRAENFVAFATVMGFFLGIITSIVTSDDASTFFAYTILITFFFYFVSQFGASLFLRNLATKKQFFPKDFHENELDLFVREINRREKMIDEVYKVTSAAAQLNAQESVA